MPKRKQKDDWKYFDHIKKKMKKLERKLQKRRRKYSSSTDSEQSSNDPKDDNIEPVNVELCEPGPSVSASSATMSYEGADYTPDVTIMTGPEEASPTPATEGPSSNDIVLQPELDEFMLDILGKDPSNTIAFGKDIQKDLAKELRKDLLEVHLTPNNCRMIAAPSLNPEIKAAVTEQVVKRDKAMEAKQKQISSGITCLSKAITLLLEKDDKDPTILKLLMDAGRIICDCQHNESNIRRNFILAVLKKDLKDQMLLTKIDSYLFGQELAETLKTAKAINKSGLNLKDLKAPAPPKSNATKSKPQPANRNLNLKAPAQNRRQQLPGPSKTKESAPPIQQHAPSLRTSRQNFSRGRR